MHRGHLAAILFGEFQVKFFDVRILHTSNRIDLPRVANLLSDRFKLSKPAFCSNGFNATLLIPVDPTLNVDRPRCGVSPRHYGTALDPSGEESLLAVLSACPFSLYSNSGSIHYQG